MNYYKRHIGDYATRTKTLTVHQHGIYNLLLDLYYTEEGPITTDDACAVCMARTPQERKAVLVILNKFFSKAGSRWRQSKCDEVIAEYQANAEKNRANGSKHKGKPRDVCETPPSGSQTDASGNPVASHSLNSGSGLASHSHKPLAINKEKEKRTLASEQKQDEALRAGPRGQVKTEPTQIGSLLARVVGA